LTGERQKVCNWQHLCMATAQYLELLPSDGCRAAIQKHPRRVDALGGDEADGDLPRGVVVAGRGGLIRTAALHRRNRPLAHQQPRQREHEQKGQPAIKLQPEARLSSEGRDDGRARFQFLVFPPLHTCEMTTVPWSFAFSSSSTWMRGTNLL
jgi:hypothetical protein